MGTEEWLRRGFEVKRVAETGEFEGYASVFDIIDQGHDIIIRGAFLRSLKERGAQAIRFLWQHDPSEPIGRIEEVREDQRGLYVRGRLLLDVARAREAHALMVAGALDGLSIGFHTVTADLDDFTGVRRLMDVDLWEISLVTFPMQPEARVTSFKTMGKTMGKTTGKKTGPITTLRAFETFLRDAGGFSRSEAKGIAAHGFSRREAGGGTGPDDWSAVMAAVQRAGLAFHS
jgi:HK97 family phage prohead protease